MVGRSDFEEKWYYEGAAISREARAKHPAIHVGFYAAMDKAGTWTPVPILFASTGCASQPPKQAQARVVPLELREHFGKA